MKKSHKNPHKTPEGYFESFNERLMDKIAKEETIIPKSDGFRAPEGYFDTFTGNVSNRLTPKVVQLHSNRKYYYAAASIAAILLMAFFVNQNNQKEFDFEDLATAELDAYFESNELELTSYELAEAINIENVDILDITDTENTIENEMIIEYLDENIDELENLNLDYEEFE